MGMAIYFAIILETQRLPLGSLLCFLCLYNLSHSQKVDVTILDQSGIAEHLLPFTWETKPETWHSFLGREICLLVCPFLFPFLYVFVFMSYFIVSFVLISWCFFPARWVDCKLRMRSMPGPEHMPDRMSDMSSKTFKQNATYMSDRNARIYVRYNARIYVR